MTISVIIPIYNVSAYVERCVLSVMNQNYSDFECIIVDDCGTDDSIEKCERMIAEYEGTIKFRIIHHQHNRGLSAARNSGTEAAVGNYILYIDSDDAITKDCIEKLMAPIVHDHTIDIVIGNAKHISDGFPLTVKPFKKYNYQDLRSNEAVRQCYFDKKGMPTYAWNKLIRKDILDNFHITFREGIIWEDILWNFYLMKYLKHIYIIGDVTYLRYIRPHSITTDLDIKKLEADLGLTYNEISRNLTPWDINREIKFYVKRFCCKYIDCSKNHIYKGTAKNFRSEMFFWRNPYESILLSSTFVLSKTWFGKMLFHNIRRIYKR